MYFNKIKKNNSILSKNIYGNFIQRILNFRYAKQLLNRKRQTKRLSPSSRYRNWYKQGKLTVNEFKRYLSVIFNMGLVKKSSIKEYWNKKDVSQSTPWFSKMFSRNRFQLILRFFHLVDNTKTSQRNTQHYNRAAWIKPLNDHANMRFKQFHVPQQ